MNLPKELFHYSANPIPNLENRPYLANPDHFMWCDEGMKPYGFWVSIEDFVEDETWHSWCVAEDFNTERLNCKHKITLKDNANILMISSSKELIEFSIKYAGNDPTDYEKMTKIPRDLSNVYRINWKEIKKEYDGVFIAPYIYSARHCMCATWYYSWDCASGCIWNMNIIESIELIDTIVEKTQDKSMAVENGSDLQLAT